MWQLPIKDWEKVPVDTYKLIHDEAKGRLDEMLSESESITNKSIKMLTSIAALFGIFLGSLSKELPPICFLVFVLLAYIAEIILLYTLIAPKQVRWRGLAPIDLIQNNIDKPEDDEGPDGASKITYFRAIGIVQENISFMFGANERRINRYRAAFIILLMLIAITIAFVIWVISRHPL